MSYAKLNIWLRFADCSLINTCWRTDLAINTCCGESLFEKDLTILEQLRERYSDYHVVKRHTYKGAERIWLQPAPWSQKHYFQHVEVDVPPGCYVVWTRVCFGRNEETNKMMVIVGCGQEACVNLVLDAVRTCTGNLFYPFFEKAVELGVPNRDLRGAARVMNVIRDKNRDDVFAELDQRLEDAEDNEELRGRIAQVKKVFDRKGGCIFKRD